MKKVTEIHGVFELFKIFDKICFNKYVLGSQMNMLSYYSENENKIEMIREDFFYCGYQFGNVYVWQPLPGEGLNVWDENFNLIAHYDFQIYFDSSSQILSNKFLASINTNEKYEGFIFSKDFSKKKFIDKYIITTTPNEFIAIKQGKKGVGSYSISNYELKWSVDLEEAYKELFIEDNEISNTRGFTANADGVYVPLEGGQLLALNVNDGSFKWILEREGSNKSGQYVLYDKFLYKMNGQVLFEIDISNGAILRKIIFEDIFSNYKANPGGKFKVYDDIILLKDARGYCVSLFDRKTFTLLDSFQIDNWNTTFLSSDASMYWHNNKVYVLDSSSILHIYERS